MNAIDADVVNWYVRLWVATWVAAFLVCLVSGWWDVQLDRFVDRVVNALRRAGVL